jgi:hypothetical protein
MGMAVKLSNELVEEARKEAKAADRSMAAQIEHWAKLGRSVEGALRQGEVREIKRTEPPTTGEILAVLERVAHTTDRSDLARELMAGRTVYQSDPAGSGLVERIEADGTRTFGTFEGRQFVAAETYADARR